MRKLFPILLAFVLFSCLPSNIHIMPDYKGKQIDNESVVIIETILTNSGDISLLNYNSSLYGWNKAFSTSIEKPGELGGLETLSINKPENPFEQKKDSIKLYASYLDIAGDIKNYSRFKNVYNYSGRSCPELGKQKFELNANDSIVIAVPQTGAHFTLPKDSVKYLLFIQMPEDLYAENGRLTLNMNFYFWDIQASKIVSYGRFKSLTTTGYDLNTEDVKREIVRRILIETPFYKGKFERRVKF